MADALCTPASMINHQAPLIVCHNILIACESTEVLATGDCDHQCDSDSFQIAIDNCSLRCVTNDMRNFVTKPQKASVTVTGIAGTAVSTCVRTVKWTVECDFGQEHV